MEELQKDFISVSYPCFTPSVKPSFKASVFDTSVSLLWSSRALATMPHSISLVIQIFSTAAIFGFSECIDSSPSTAGRVFRISDTLQVTSGIADAASA